jgi:hypothetical protein
MSSESGSGAAATEERRTVKYHQAAVLYFAYGVLYLSKVVMLGKQSGWNMHGYPSWVAWIAIPLGAIITITFPYLIWRQVRWFTMVLAVIVFIRTVYLFVQPEVGFYLGPFLVAAPTAWMLARAAWDL